MKNLLVKTLPDKPTWQLRQFSFRINLFSRDVSIYLVPCQSANKNPCNFPKEISNELKAFWWLFSRESIKVLRAQVVLHFESLMCEEQCILWAITFASLESDTEHSEKSYSSRVKFIQRSISFGAFDLTLCISSKACELQSKSKAKGRRENVESTFFHRQSYNLLFFCIRHVHLAHHHHLALFLLKAIKIPNWKFLVANLFRFVRLKKFRLSSCTQSNENERLMVWDEETMDKWVLIWTCDCYEIHFSSSTIFSPTLALIYASLEKGETRRADMIQFAFAFVRNYRLSWCIAISTFSGSQRKTCFQSEIQLFSAFFVSKSFPNQFQCWRKLN